MPPRAARQGSTALRSVASEPRRSSCLISRPTTKKKMAMRPSFTHARSESACDPMCGPMCIDQKPSHAELVMPQLARLMERTVAPTRMAPGSVPCSTTSVSSSTQCGMLPHGRSAAVLPDSSSSWMSGTALAFPVSARTRALRRGCRDTASGARPAIFGNACGATHAPTGAARRSTITARHRIAKRRGICRLVEEGERKPREGRPTQPAEACRKSSLVQHSPRLAVAVVQPVR